MCVGFVILCITMKKFLEDFKSFAMKGNVVDLAVGVIIGTAFGKIVSSLVGDIAMPLLGMLLGGIDFADLTAGVGTANLQYGKFIQAIIDFLVIALSVFVFIRFMGRVTKKFEKQEAKKEAVPPKKSEEARLLEEIRDVLTAKK